VRRFFKSWTVGFTLGLAVVSGVTAGVVVGPVGRQVDLSPSQAESGALAPAALRTAPAATQPSQVQALANKKVALKLPGRLAGGTFLVGADATSLYPAPQLYKGTWQKEGCAEFSVDDPGAGNLDQTHLLPGDGHGWPGASKDCIYLAAFGLGPARAARTVDDGGVWVRSLAISNGKDTIVLQIVDTPGFLYAFNASVCDGCGIFDITRKIAADTGLPAASISVGSTHTHAGPDLYGGWGGIPIWYASQIRDSVIASAKQALLRLRKATITVGEVVLRGFNGERRDTYYSVPDYQATWLQARGTGPKTVIATLANFAGHPTIVGGPILHADWPGATDRRLERLYGGTGLLFNGGLGNMSIRGRSGKTEDEEAENTGVAFADAIAADIRDGGTRLGTNDVVAKSIAVSHPVTNLALAASGLLNLTSRDSLPGGPGADTPGAYHWSKERAPDPGDFDEDSLGYTRGCDTASPMQVKTVVAGYRVGNALILVAPGEIFSNMAITAKSRTSGSAMTFVFGQTNDSLGYIIQSFEFDPLGNAATEYGTRTGEYEEVFSLDRCFGDHVLQTMLDIGRQLGF
jgi:hypothetical protein